MLCSVSSFKRTFVFNMILSIRCCGGGKGGSAIVVLIIRILLRLSFISIVSAHIALALIIRVVAHISVEIAITTSAAAESSTTTRGSATPVMIAVRSVGSRARGRAASSRRLTFETAAVRMMAIHDIRFR